VAIEEDDRIYWDQDGGYGDDGTQVRTVVEHEGCYRYVNRVTNRAIALATSSALEEAIKAVTLLPKDEALAWLQSRAEAARLAAIRTRTAVPA
jgi:hypothetical protein